MQILIRPPYPLRPDHSGRRKDAPIRASYIIVGMTILVAVVTVLAIGLTALALPA